MAKRTLGPWHVEPLDGDADALAICYADGIVCEVHREDDGLQDIDRADANLIAAAPDLLEQLKALYGAVRGLAPDNGNKMTRAVEAAIAKAEGRS